MALLILMTILCFLWLFPRPLKQAIHPRILALASVFCMMYFVFYVQPIIIAEHILGQKVYQWLTLEADAYEAAKLFLGAYLLIFLTACLIHGRSVPARSFKLRPYKRIHLLIFASFATFGAYIYSTGGVWSFLQNHREAVYSDQWSGKSNYTRIVCSALFFFFSILGGYLAGTDANITRRRRIAYLLLPLPGTLVKVALLSRGFFIFYSLWFVARVVARPGTKNLKLKLILLSALTILGVYLGLSLRTDDYEGFANLYDAFLFVANGFNGTSGFLDSYAIAIPDLLKGTVRVVGQFSPLPSFVLPFRYDNNLTSLVFGIREGSAAPMPFIGEAYYNLGWGALAVAYMQGFWSALVTRQVALKRGSKSHAWWILIYLTTLYWFMYMPHSGLRACTRPLAWTLLAWFVFSLIQSIWSGRAKRFSHRMLPDTPHFHG